MRFAITRRVGPGIGRCELTHLERREIDVDLASAQHRRYERSLAELGCDVRSLPPEPDLPDSVFVEDAAVVFRDLAVITRPGARSRRLETPSVAEALRPYRPLEYIEAPATVDGGDVLVLGRRVYVGLSGRTNEAGVEQMRSIVEPWGHQVVAVPVEGCLHLKSAVGRVAPDTLLVNRRWVGAGVFSGVRLMDVDFSEPRAAGALLIGERVLYPARFRRTLERLRRAHIDVVEVELSELAKAEAGVTCCSLVFEA